MPAPAPSPETGRALASYVLAILFTEALLLLGAPPSGWEAAIALAHTAEGWARHLVGAPPDGLSQVI